MKKLTLYIGLLVALPACNEGTREISDSPEKVSIPENRYESTVNQTLNNAKEPDNQHQAPNFSFRPSFTEQQVEQTEASNTVIETPETVLPPASETKVETTTPAPKTNDVLSPPATSPPQKTATVTNLPKNDTLNVRKRAGTNIAILEKLPPNSLVVVTGKSKTTKDGQRWVEIITNNKTTGWVNNHYLKAN